MRLDYMVPYHTNYPTIAFMTVASNMSVHHVSSWRRGSLCMAHVRVCGFLPCLPTSLVCRRIFSKVSSNV